MNILITGGTGFLGRHLHNSLSKDPANKITIINTKNCNLLERDNLLAYKSQKYDQIYHLAAWTKAGEFCLYHPGEQWIHNQYINTNVLWFWKEFQSQALLIAMGTSCAYPDGEQDLVEQDYMVGEPSKDLYTYAMTKRMLLQGLKALETQYGMKYQYLIPSTLYGPDFEVHDNHFIFDLIKKISAAKHSGVAPTLWGNGEQIRELIHVDDAIGLIKRCSEGNFNNVINLGSGNGKTIREYAQIVANKIGFPAENIIYDESAKYIGVKRRVLCNKKLLTMVGNFQFTNIKAGISRVIDNFNQKQLTTL